MLFAPRTLVLSILTPAFLLLGGCADTPPALARAVRVVTPETVTVGVTMPNLFSGPTSATPDGPMHRDAAQSRFGTIGGTITATYRLKPIRIERAEVQPVRIVRAVPLPAPTPASNGNP